MKRAKKGRERSWTGKKSNPGPKEEDKSGISRRQEENFDRQRQGIVDTRTRTFTPLISLGFPHCS